MDNIPFTAVWFLEAWHSLSTLLGAALLLLLVGLSQVNSYLIPYYPSPVVGGLIVLLAVLLFELYRKDRQIKRGKMLSKKRRRQEAHRRVEQAILDALADMRWNKEIDAADHADLMVELGFKHKLTELQPVRLPVEQLKTVLRNRIGNHVTPKLPDANTGSEVAQNSKRADVAALVSKYST